MIGKEENETITKSLCKILKHTYEILDRISNFIKISPYN